VGVRQGANIFMMNRPIILFVLMAAAIATVGGGCEWTTTVPKPPVYGEPMDSLRVQVLRLVQCQHFDVDGSSITRNKKKHTQLRIEVVNGKDIPEGSAMWELGKQLAVAVRHALRDTTEYDEYQVTFTTEEQSPGSVSKHYTTRSFQSADL
jgi:hypothetical protein